MIQVNLLLPTAGKHSDPFITNDLMRLPLGVLTSIGFIGGGAIIKRDDIAVGVTTAATLWSVTVIGLCFGGGQIWLGVAPQRSAWPHFGSSRKSRNVYDGSAAPRCISI
jgi:putative Mg2+ transporter-C (MgtC) family protein